jgi:hypothetical protein
MRTKCGVSLLHEAILQHVCFLELHIVYSFSQVLFVADAYPPVYQTINAMDAVNWGIQGEFKSPTFEQLHVSPCSNVPQRDIKSMLILEYMNTMVLFS